MWDLRSVLGTEEVPQFKKVMKSKENWYRIGPMLISFDNVTSQVLTLKEATEDSITFVAFL